ncbi:crotonase/enoyl-CoA hydratase family protein [Paracoccaceae bacterium GXU_MW_L88]
MRYQTITLDVDGRGVALLTLDNPEKHNALSPQMIAELTEVAGEIGGREDIRVVVLTGAGKSFCAGGDLAWMKTQMTASRAQRMSEARKLADMLGALNRLPKPLIGKVQGQAFGGGIGMMSVCDVVIAAEGLKFGLTEVRLGIIPATISPYVLARMGEGHARAVMLSGGLFDTARAQELGLVAKMVAPDALDAAIEAEIKPYLSASPVAVAATKKLIRDVGYQVREAEIDASIEALADVWETDDAMEGVSAFFEKRKARWMPE